MITQEEAGGHVENLIDDPGLVFLSYGGHRLGFPQRKLEQCGAVGSGAMLHSCPFSKARRGAELLEREAGGARSWC